MSFKPLLLLALLLPALPLSAAIAADPPPAAVQQDEFLELESFVVTATRRKVRVLDVTEAVTLVQAARITGEAPRVLAELLRGQPGTFFQETTPGQGIPIIRGLKGSEVLHLVDGMRLNNAFFRNAPNQYVALVDSYAVDRIEVIRGAAPSLHGADAMGGVVQILTREPEFFGSTWQGEGRFYATWNSVDSSLIGHANGAVGKTGSVLSGGVTWEDYGDRTAGGGTVVAPTGFKVRAGDVKWSQEVSAAAELMLSAQILEQPSTPRIDELIPGYGETEPSSLIYEFKPNRRSFLHARYRQHSTSPWFERMEIHVARQVMVDDRLSQEFGTTELVDESNQSTLDGVTLQFNTPWGAVAGNARAVGAGAVGENELVNELVWGIEYYTDGIDSSRLRTDTDSGASTQTRGRYPDDSSMESLALYAANRRQWGSLAFETGLRYSMFDISMPAEGTSPAVRLEPNDLTGDVHAAWELQPGLRLVSNFGRGFRPPNIFDLGSLGPRPGNRYNQPNPDLQPESVLSYDLGLKSVGTSWEAEFFVFYSDYRDKLTSVFTGETTPDGRLIVQSQNLNKATLYGFESGINWHFANGVDVNAALNYTHGEEQDVQAGTAPADRVPPLNGRLELTYEPGLNLRLQPWIDFAARQHRLSPRDAADPRIAPGGTPGYATFNFLLSWQATPGVELGLRLENLGDTNYREHGSGIDAPGRNFGVWLNALF